MQTVVIAGIRQALLVERPDPEPVSDLVVVRILASPMCTEYKTYRDGHQTIRLGHEAAGVVESIAQPGKVSVGDRVVVMPQYPCGQCALCLAGDYIHCEDNLHIVELTGSEWGTATYAQYLIKSDWLLVPIPDDISTEHASMACCGLGPTFGAMQSLHVNAFDTVLITGMGPVGLGGVINGRFRGARVFAVESHPYRTRLAMELGAEAVFDPRDPEVLKQIQAKTGGKGADMALDCSGSAAAQRLLIDATRRKGRVAFIGEGGDLTVHVSNDLIRKGLTLYGGWHYNHSETQNIMQVIRRSSALLDKLITHSFPMSQVQDAFELQLTGNCGKVILHPWQQPTTS